jgi:beta-amylase
MAGKHSKGYPLPLKNADRRPLFLCFQLNTVDENNKLHNPEQLEKDFAALKSIGVDGVMCDVWWGLVEREGPGKYDWNGYHELFKRVAAAGLKLQVRMRLYSHAGILRQAFVNICVVTVEEP